MTITSAVDYAVTAYLARPRHLEAVDEWLVELEREHGPVPSETLSAIANGPAHRRDRVCALIADLT